MGFRSRRPAALAAAVTMVILLAGCWPVPGGNADRTAHNSLEGALTTATVADLAPAWTADLGPGNSGPVVLDRGAVFVRVDNSVAGLDARTGDTRWTWEAPDDVLDIASVGEPLVVEGRVLIGYGAGNLGGRWAGVALDPRTGEAVAGPVATGLLSTARGTIVASITHAFGTGTPVLTSYQLTDLSGATTVNGGRLSIRSGSGPLSRLTVGRNGVYHAGSGLVAGPGGWTQGDGVRGFPFQPAGTCGPPTAEAFACPEWVTAMSAVTDVVIGPGETILYVGQSGGSVAALDPATGAVQWTAAVGAEVTATPALADGVLYVPTADGDLVAVDAAGCSAATCTPLWSAAVDGTALAQQPAVAGSGADAVVFAGTQGGTLAAVPAAGCGAATCAPLWQTSVGAEVTGAPAVTAGRVVVGTRGGRIAAFHLPPA